MATEENDVQALLAQAPPGAPTAQDAEAAKAASTADAARTLADVTSENQYRSLTGVGGGAPSSKYNSGTPTPAPGSFGDRLASALKTAQASTDPGMMTQPNSWAKIMVGSVMDALSGKPGAPSTGAQAEGPSAEVSSPATWAAARSNADASKPTTAPTRAEKPTVGQPILDAIGDVSAAPGPGGFWGGFARTAAATTARERQQREDQRVMAASNATMLHEQALTHKLGEDQINAAVESGKQGLSAITSAEVPGQIVARDKTSDELDQMIKSGQIDPTKQTVFLTGRSLVGKDANDQPMYRSTYSVVTPAGPVKPSDEQADYIEKFTGIKLRGESGDKAANPMPAVQFNQLWQSAQHTEAVRSAFMVKNAEDQEKIDKAQNSKDAQTLFQNPTFQKVISMPGIISSPGDPFARIKAYNTIVNDDKLLHAPGMPKNFTAAFKLAMGGDTEFNKAQEEYLKAQKTNTDAATQALQTFETKPGEIAGKYPDYEAYMSALIKDPKQSADIKDRATKALSIIKDAEANDLKFKAEEAGGKKKAEENAALQDTGALIEAAKNYQLDPKDMAGVRGGQRIEFMNKMLKEDPTWSEPLYKARYQTVQDFRPEGKAGLQIGSLNTFAEHAKTAADRIPYMHNTASPLYNTVMNKIKVQVGDEQFGRMTAALEAVKDEYLNFLKNAHATTSDEQARAESILNPNMSPKTIRGVIEQMAETVAKRGGQLQRNYITTMGKPYLGMLDPDNNDTLKSWGVDTDKMNGVPNRQNDLRSQHQSGQPIKYQVGDKIVQNGRTLTVTSVDANGKPTGAN